jgi:hypothetical protein
MSLKSFHIFFIAIATLLAAACAVWAFYFGASQVFGVSCVIAAVALIVYGIWFIRKSRNIIT